MPPPLPALTFVLTFMLVLQLTVVVYASPYTAFNSRFYFHNAFLSQSLNEKICSECGTDMRGTELTDP